MSVHYGGRGPGHMSRSMGGFIPNYYISPTGSDAADGLTLATAWQSLNKFTASLIATGQTKRVLVKAGTYDKATDQFVVALTTQTGTTTIVQFEPGCIIDGTAFTLGTQNGVSFRSDIPSDRTNNFFAYGNGCIVRDVTTADGNGLDGSGGGFARFYDFTVTNCRDGISIHETQEAEFHRINASDCLKWAAAHVGSSVTRHYGCTFLDANNTATLGGLVAFDSTNATHAENCTFLPGTTSAAATLRMTGPGSTFTRCQIGTTTRLIEFQPYNSGTATITDSFVNIYSDGLYGPATLNRAFGKFSFRTGPDAAGSITMDNCSISGPATGKTAVFYNNYTPASSVPLYISDSVFETASFMDVDATNAGYLVAAGSTFRNNCTFGSTYDADLVSAGATITGTVTTDPLIGAANTLLMADYAYATGSPCIGAGQGGTNIGFSASEAVTVGA